MSKFLLNLLVQISKAFVYSKIQILFENNSSQILVHPAQPRPCRPVRPTGYRARARPTQLEQPWRICQKAPLLRVCAVRQWCFPSLTSLPSGARPSVPPLPRAGRPKFRLHRASPHLIAPRLPASIIEMPIKAPYSPALIAPLESPLTPPGHQWRRP
jgi:hypothetical protein